MRVSIRTGRNADGRDLQRPDLHVLVTPRGLQTARQARGEHPAEGQAGGCPGTPAPSRLTFVWRATALSKPAADYCMRHTRRPHRRRPWRPARRGAAGSRTAPRQTRRSAGAAASTPENRAQRSQEGRLGSSGSADAGDKMAVTWTAALMSLTLKPASASAATASLTYCATAHPLESAIPVRGPARCVCGLL